MLLHESFFFFFAFVMFACFIYSIGKESSRERLERYKMKITN